MVHLTISKLNKLMVHLTMSNLIEIMGQVTMNKFGRFMNQMTMNKLKQIEDLISVQYIFSILLDIQRGTKYKGAHA